MIFLGAFLLACQTAAALSPVHTTGKYFFTEDGFRFSIKGVAYQRNEGTEVLAKGYIDSLADTARCQRDVEYMKQLDVNTVRTYAIDPDMNHDGCMRILDDAGIYVIADLATPDQAIDRDHPSWNLDLMNKFERTIDTMQKYPNMLGFLVGNEVITSPMSSRAGPIVRAAIRDMKHYITSKGYRKIPIGYAADDHEIIRPRVLDYLNCGEDRELRPDFLGINMYSWCGDSNFERSGYKDRVAEVSNYEQPVIATEFGCNLVTPRQFGDVKAFFSDAMSKAFSGGIAYMYFQESNNFGLVQEGVNGVQPLQDFFNLRAQYQSVELPELSESEYTPHQYTAKCPKNNRFWSATTDLPDTPDTNDCDCMMKSLGCVVNPETDRASIRSLFGVVCGMDGVSCNAIMSDGQNPGMYGPWAQCGEVAKLSWAFNDYFRKHGSTNQVCFFNGHGLIREPAADDICEEAVEQIERFIPPPNVKPWMKNSYRYHKLKDVNVDENAVKFNGDNNIDGRGIAGAAVRRFALGSEQAISVGLIVAFACAFIVVAPFMDIRSDTATATTQS